MKKTVIIVLFFLVSTAFSQTHPEFRAVKITNVDSDILFDDAKIAEGMDYLASIGINVILPVVWNSSGADGDYTLYPSDVMDNYFGTLIHPAIPLQRDPLKRIIIEAHRNGMEVMPWFEMGFSTSYSQNGGHIISRYPDWALKDNSGNLCVKNGFDWMSPIHPEVQEFIIALVTEVLDNYDVDGVEFSDRIPAMPVEGGYEEITVLMYQDEHDGALPPANYKDAAWMRWRADKLSAWLQAVRDSVKTRSEHLILSSSPSVYPWSYDNYLQDSKTWVDNDIVDNIIPQLYRYNYNDYVYELNKSLGFVPALKRDIFYSGMLLYLKGDNYLISPDFLLKSIQANRDRNVFGEALFFYEGLRLHNNQLGDTLKATYYSESALLPHRNGNSWRPKGVIVNEDDADVEITGNWENSSIVGFEPNILIKKDASYASITYYFDVPFDGWFDVFAYIVTGSLTTDRAPFTVYSGNDSSIVYVDQQNIYNRGWQPLKSVYLTKGRHKVLKLDNQDVPTGQYVVADAAMIMINRKLSPDVVVTSIQKDIVSNSKMPIDFELFQNYPNPFNASTIIRFSVQNRNFVKVKVYDTIGREVVTLLDEIKNPGIHEINFYGKGLTSGVYFYKLQVGESAQVRKLVLIK